jgi:hypothetical protein
MFHRFKYITSCSFCQALSAKNINKKKLCPLVKTTELLEIRREPLEMPREKGLPDAGRVLRIVPFTEAALLTKTASQIKKSGKRSSRLWKCSR